MVRTSGALSAFALVAVLAPAAAANASIVIDSGDPLNPDDDLLLDLTASVGTGLFSSYLVVDFAATGGDTYAFEWRWNPGDDARGFTMISAIVEGTDLAADIGGEDGVGFGIWINNFVLPTEDEIGDPANFWAYWNADAEDIDPGVDWSFAEVGASGRILDNGSIDGWYNGFDGSMPSVPVIPAPSALAALAGFGLLGGSASRRRRG